MNEKECPYCRVSKPLTDFYYRARDGYAKKCKECTLKEQKSSRETKKRTCSKCGQTKPSKFFKKIYTSLCIDCYRESRRRQSTFDHNKGKKKCPSCGKLFTVSKVFKEGDCPYCGKHYNLSVASDKVIKIWIPPVDHSEKVLSYIEKNPHSYQEQIARVVNISHTSVNKIVSQLEKDGKVVVSKERNRYSIEAVVA